MIVNTVNCKGFMGAGLALEFKLRYPEMFEDYKEKCSDGLIKVGNLDIYENEEIKILNFPTKDDWKRPSNINWIKMGLLYFYNNYKKFGIHTIAFPKLGTKNGGLDWEEVKDLMERCFANLDELTVYICLDNSTPKGTEGKMLSILNNLTDKELNELGLRANAIENLKNNLPMKRFFQLSKIKGLGTKSYKKLHAYCYKKVTDTDNGDEAFKQLSIFESE
ncbi:hypothetical protein CIB95_08965 [Lottiidibacillus patelloidae]|uniref:Macro domain-containing protein n=2 Tax=Lottiidibacillus patelloidae TaxID=2670334 RepID=A0A263BTP2_9BACI|nr:hypothetical protein CIB95_08965 [Lottiidibacillus patelloidae]